MILTAKTDRAVKDMARRGDALAIAELAKRGLTSTAETRAELIASRKKYRAKACDAGIGWGMTGRR